MKVISVRKLTHKAAPGSFNFPLQRNEPKYKRISILRCTAVMSSDPSLVVVPIFRGNQPLLPTTSGRMEIYEPHYVEIFKELGKAHPSKRGHFLHIMSSKAAPIGLREPALENLPKVGTVATVKSITMNSDETLSVEYEGYRRATVLMISSKGGSIGTTAAIEWLDDFSPENVATLNSAERDLAAALRHLQALAAKLTPGKAILPDAVLRYAPRASIGKRTSYDALKAAGHQAATAIDTWRRHGSVYDTSCSSTKVDSQYGDPYLQLQQEIESDRRAELFSFAAAQLLEAGIPEKTALLLTRDTEARLQFVLHAVRPYIQQLSAEAAVRNAFQRP